MKCLITWTFWYSSGEIRLWSGSGLRYLEDFKMVFLQFDHSRFEEELEQDSEGILILTSAEHNILIIAVIIYHEFSNLDVWRRWSHYFYVIDSGTLFHRKNIKTPIEVLHENLETLRQDWGKKKQLQIPHFLFMKRSWIKKNKHKAYLCWWFSSSILFRVLVEHIIVMLVNVILLLLAYLRCSYGVFVIGFLL